MKKRRMTKKGQDTPQYLVALTLITLIALIVIGLIGKLSTVTAVTNNNDNEPIKMVEKTVKGSSENTQLIKGGNVRELAYND